ncbi:putative Transmembrane protein [Heracleum sosnowskyi]|uniref:Transmembrane protein n=1 Tax=Heracleum sosnowskyi TaxID=360622 RepID=A0AAD8MXR9_9APIA|nr:putative Transmembrane protein [Heracleum sosnowskyi]
MYPRGNHHHHHMGVEDRRGSAPYGILFVVVVALLVVIPLILGEQGEALTEILPELLSPLGLLLLPIILLLTIQFLSSESGSSVSSIFATGGGGPESIHRATGSPVGVALFLLLVLILLYSRISIFGGDDDSDE